MITSKQPLTSNQTPLSDEGNTGFSEFVTYSTSNNIRYSYLTLNPTALVESYICTVSYSDFSDNLLVSSVSVSTISESSLLSVLFC